MEDVYALRHKVFVEGKSQRQVAREMGLARHLALARDGAAGATEAQAVAAGAGAGAAAAGAVARRVVGAHHGKAAHHGPEAAPGAAGGRLRDRVEPRARVPPEVLLLAVVRCGRHQQEVASEPGQ